MPYKHPTEIPLDETAVIGGVSGKKVFVIDNNANQITNFAQATVALNSLATLGASPNYVGLVTVTEAVPYSSPSVVIGMVSSASGGLVQFATNAVKWVGIKASYANPTTAYIGGSNATVNNGFNLAPGDSIGMAISNTNQLYLVGVGTTEVRFLGGN